MTLTDALANKALTAAAKRAGAHEAYVAHESVCSTTYFVIDEAEKAEPYADKIFEVGETIAVVDLGGAYVSLKTSRQASAAF